MPDVPKEIDTLTLPAKAGRELIEAALHTVFAARMGGYMSPDDMANIERLAAALAAPCVAVYTREITDKMRDDMTKGLRGL